ncbi:MAG TPA: hypothetical protein PLW14_06995 [Chlorobiota bacterium]|nr:hypothetical protein [Chlorobiota bacterium]
MTKITVCKLDEMWVRRVLMLVYTMVLVFLFCILGSTRSLAAPITVLDSIGFRGFVKIPTEPLFGINQFLRCDDAVYLVSANEIRVSKDTGLSWQYVTEPLKYRSVSAVTAWGDTTVVGTRGGGVYISTNAGLTWKRWTALRVPDTVRAIVSVKQDIAILSADGTLFTTDLDDILDGDSPDVIDSGIVSVFAWNDEFHVLRTSGSVGTFSDTTFSLPHPVAHDERVLFAPFQAGIRILVGQHVYEQRTDTKDIDTLRVLDADWTAADINDNVLVYARRDGSIEIDALDASGYRENIKPTLSEASAIISALAVTDSTIAVGTRRGPARIYLFQRKRNQWRPLSTSRPNVPFDVVSFVRADNRLFVATQQEGVMEVSSSRNVVVNLSDGYAESIFTHGVESSLGLLITSRQAGIVLIRSCLSEPEWLPLPVDRRQVITCGARDNVLAVALRNGGVLVSRNSGRSWKRSPFPGPLINKIVVDGDAINALTVKGIMTSNDDGESWRWRYDTTTIGDAHLLTTVNGMTFISHRVSTSVEDGNTTAPVPLNPPERFPSRISSLLFHNGVFIAAGLPCTYTSSDNGVSWQQHPIPDVKGIRAQIILGDTYLCAVDNGDIWRAEMMW